MLLPQKDYSKYLIVFEIFAMFRFSDLEKKWCKINFFSKDFSFEPRYNKVI